MSDTGNHTVCLGKIGAAHGIQGHVRVKPFTEHPENFGNYGPLFDEKGGRTFKIASLRVIKGGMLVVKFKGVNDRDSAEALNGTKLYVDRTALPQLDDGDDFYIDDLIGLAVRDTDGNILGRIVSVQNFGADDLIEMKPPHGASFYIPFTKSAVPNVFIGDGFIEVNVEEAGHDLQVRGNTGAGRQNGDFE